MGEDLERAARLRVGVVDGPDAGQRVALAEIERLGGRVVGADAYDGDDICMIASKLLDAGGFPDTCRSMRCPEPDEHGFGAVE